eukprot:SAG22_NODE_2564_length_2435_cov_3.836473_4_plen_94_part_01
MASRSSSKSRSSESSDVAKATTAVPGAVLLQATDLRDGARAPEGLAGQVAAAVASRGDEPFGTFALAPDGRALNPLINSGALVVLELLSRSHTE